ncbi:MAG: PLP-dependent aspartate aminotransferase family protein [Candidatus Aminicenantes bacterium]
MEVHMKEKKVKTVRTPIYRDAAFFLEAEETMKKAFKDEKDNPRSPGLYIYSRYRNPTVVATEDQIIQLEGARWALLTQSGMSAIDVALSIFQKADETGTWLFFSEIYGGTNSYIDRVLQFRRGINIKRFYPTDDQYDLNQLEKLLAEEKPRLVYFEGISNPLLVVSDCESIIRMSKQSGAVVIVDNTFATPYLWKPLEYGADIVLHSATKYLSGHNNIIAGVLCGNDAQMEKDAIEYRKYTGHMLSADDAYRLGTQLRTFELRFERHCENAARLAKVLAAHEKIETVLYPGLESHPTHDEAKKLFKEKGFGAMITFDIKRDTPEKQGEAARRFISAVSDRIPLVPTLGDAGTTILHVESVWGDKYPLPGMIRLSVGIENYQDLEAAVLNGLDRIEA